MSGVPGARVYGRRGDSSVKHSYREMAHKHMRSTALQPTNRSPSFFLVTRVVIKSTPPRNGILYLI